MDNNKLYTELVLIHTELLMIEKILLKDMPDDYKETLDNKLFAQSDLMKAILSNYNENGGNENG